MAYHGLFDAGEQWPKDVILFWQRSVRLQFDFKIPRSVSYNLECRKVNVEQTVKELGKVD